MSDFKTITDTLFASAQIHPGDVQTARDQGITLVINNRPDDEEPGQPSAASIETAARDLGLDYRHIPVTSAGFSLPQVEAMEEAVASAQGKVLAFCRSGTRSTLLWALAQAKSGRDTDAIATDAAKGGYDVSPVRPTMDMLAGRSSE